MSNYLTEALDEALRKFGTYTYGDKGAYEVMDVKALTRHLLTLPADQVIEDMAVLAKHEHGAELYTSLVADLVEDELHPETDDLYRRLPIEPDGIPMSEYHAKYQD